MLKVLYDGFPFFTVLETFVFFLSDCGGGRHVMFFFEVLNKALVRGERSHFLFFFLKSCRGLGTVQYNSGGSF